MNDTATSLNAGDIRRILELMPHRYPFLLIDKVININGDLAGVGIKNVTVNEPQFQGHFPGMPVFPGVLILEAMAQTAGFITMAGYGHPPKAVYFTTVDDAKFRKPVFPGDRLELHMTKEKGRKNMSWYRGEAKVDALVAEALVGAMYIME